jgi:hypothetical protein
MNSGLKRNAQALPSMLGRMQEYQGDKMRLENDTYYRRSSIHLGMRIYSPWFLQSLGAQLDFSRKDLYSCICVPFSPESLGIETLILQIHGRLNDKLTRSVEPLTLSTFAAPPLDCVIL